MRDVLLKIVGDLTIAESNCPRGARVAVVTYNNEVTTEIRFADSKKKSVLLDKIKNLQVALTSKQQSLETAMSFVARNTFKRVRNGFLMRKVAVFFSNKPTRASQQLREAVLKLSDAGITPLFLTSQEDRQLINALQVCALCVSLAPPSVLLGPREGSQTHLCLLEEFMWNFPKLLDEVVVIGNYLSEISRTANGAGGRATSRCL